MGAGKGYVLSWMSRSGYFPLENIVHVDPYAAQGSNPGLADPSHPYATRASNPRLADPSHP